MRNEMGHTVVLFITITIHKTLPGHRPPKPHPGLLGGRHFSEPQGSLHLLDSKPSHFGLTLPLESRYKLLPLALLQWKRREGAEEMQEEDDILSSTAPPLARMQGSD